MIISPLQSTFENNIKKVSTTLLYESSGDEKEIWISSSGENSLTEDMNGFLLAAFLPAWYAGERRILVEGDICPLLHANLSTVCSLMKLWFNDWKEPPEIKCNFSTRKLADETGLFMSGGVDSLASLKRLTDKYPPGDMYRPSAAVLIDYQGIKRLSDEETALRLQGRKERCLKTTREKDVELLTVSTNFRELCPNGEFWAERYHGAVLAAVAHFKSYRFRRFNIASSIAARHFGSDACKQPWGSHPLLDGCYSSEHLEVVHHGYDLARLDKVGVLADWDAALNNMQVCTSPTSGGGNCGKCKKCIRTKLYLLIHGSLDKSNAFDSSGLTVDDINSLKISKLTVYIFFRDCLPHIKRVGRDDLAMALEKQLKRFDSFYGKLKRMRRRK